MRSLRLNSSEKGASVVEFALVLPLLLLLLFGIIEFGIILFDKAMLTNACREGARAGIVSCSPRVAETEIVDITRGYCASNLITFASSPPPPDVIVTFPASLTFGNDLKVQANFIYEFLVVSALIPGLPHAITLEAETVMKYE